ncbi:MAG: signal recognition particle-docking protein FtsY [Bdellovibrionales bacterium]
MELNLELIAAGIALASALVGGAGFFWFKSRKTKAPSAFEDLLQQKKRDPSAPLPEGTENIEFDGKILVPESISAVPQNLTGILAPTKRAFSEKFKSIFGARSLEKFPFEEIEEALYTSDLGPTTVQRLLESLQEQLTKKQLYNYESLREAIRNEIQNIVGAVNTQSQVESPLLTLEKNPAGPIVWLIVGVNGAGKTTSIGKLAGWACERGLKVLVAAGDTFRAAAGSQLAVWSERAKVEIFEGDANAKPSGVAFDATQKALKEKFDLLIVDTAGRLHTQANLMEELAKIKRVIEKAYPSAPHETLLVLDANNGQNALVQAKQFHQALNVSGVILTKLDGTAKGGVVVGLAHELKLPIKAIGVGEKLGDLRGFSTPEFVDSLI